MALSPRQSITSAPYSGHAKTAFALAAADGSLATAVIVDSAGKVGIGVLAPTHTIHAASTVPTLALQDTDSDGGKFGQQVGYLSYRDASNVERAWVGFGSAGDPDLSIVNARPSGDIVLNPFNGSVGIGTASPTAKLEVHGDIRLGSAGQLFAASGDANLRIVRGTVSANAQILAGDGFTVTHLGPGTYRLNFLTPFSGIPTLTAVCDEEIDNLGEKFFTTGVFAVGASSGQVRTRFFDANTGFYGKSVNEKFNFIAVGPR